MSQKHSHTLSLSTVAYLGFGKGAPPEAETVFGNRKFAHFSEIWKHERPSNIVEFCNFFWKMAKNAPFHIKSPVKNFHGLAKGGPSHRGLSPKYATARKLCGSFIDNARCISAVVFKK